MFLRAVQGSTPLADRDRVPPAPRDIRPDRHAPSPAPTITVTGRGSSLAGRAPGVSMATVRSLAGKDRAPHATLDLHGRRAADVPGALARFFATAEATGWRTLRIVVGRGLRSHGEPVLGDAVVNAMCRAPLARCVLAFCAAPPRLGGEGAILVMLRKS